VRCYARTSCLRSANPKAEIARLLGVSRKTLYDIMAEKAAGDPKDGVATRKLCGNGSDLWINLLVISEREL
jgi:plasmid maintenance system antidote protein VapI